MIQVKGRGVGGAAIAACAAFLLALTVPSMARADEGLLTCNDGIIGNGPGSSEHCEDYNGDNTDDCLVNCKIASCGDGYLHDHHSDTDATNLIPDLKLADGQTVPELGDEECDDGGMNTENCDEDCTYPECDDDILNEAAGEECFADEPGCDANCHAICGDGILIGPYEECDDSNTDPGDGCDANCMWECGNGVLDMGEMCDDGGRADGNGCSALCLFEMEYTQTCGDGIISIMLPPPPMPVVPTAEVLPPAAEECDDGNNNDGDGCSSTCTIEAPICGNGVVQNGEQCDGEEGCDVDCTWICGNGVLDEGEECDSEPGCDEDCMWICGDGVVQGDEECDDGNDWAQDYCKNNCMLNEIWIEEGFACGDGIPTLPEMCDDGNNISGDGCDANCMLENSETVECGNGLVEFPGIVEECDDGNAIDDDACSNACQLTSASVVDGTGTGDDGSTTAGENGGDVNGAGADDESGVGADGDDDGGGCSLVPNATANALPVIMMLGIAGIAATRRRFR